MATHTHTHSHSSRVYRISRYWLKHDEWEGWKSTPMNETKRVYGIYIEGKKRGRSTLKHVRVNWGASRAKGIHTHISAMDFSFFLSEKGTRNKTGFKLAMLIRERYKITSMRRGDEKSTHTHPSEMGGGGGERERVRERSAHKEKAGVRDGERKRATGRRWGGMIKRRREREASMKISRGWGRTVFPAYSTRRRRRREWRSSGSTYCRCLSILSTRNKTDFPPLVVVVVGVIYI